MAIFQLINNMKMTLAVNLESDDTELVVLDSDLTTASGYDPTKQLSLTLIGDEELNQYEIVYATQRTGTTFTVIRGQENTTAGEWSSGTQIIAALTANVLRDTASAPTSADNVAYGGGNFGASGTVEQTLDSMGDAIITQAADTEYYEAVQQRISGSAFSGGAANTTNLRWQGGAKRFATNGLGAVITTVATIGIPAVVPDIAMCLRCADVTNWGTVKVRAYQNAGGPTTNYIEWTIAKTSMPSNNAWLIAFLPASAGTVVGSPSTNLPDRVQITIQDASTGVLTLDVNFLDVVAQRLSYLGAFIQVATPADWPKVDSMATYGFRVSIIIKDTVISTLDPLKIRGYQFDGHRIYTTSNSNFKAQTSAQVRVVLYTALRSFFSIGVIPDGWVYLNRWAGPLDLEPNVTVRQLVSLAYKVGVGVGTFRSAIEVYHFDDPLVVATDLANARTYLTGADRTAINIDLSALTAADILTLSGEISGTGNFYTTTLDYQNADNLKSGTVAPARLPIVPINKGGTNAVTAVAALQSLGLYDASQNIIAPAQINAAGQVNATTMVTVKAASGNIHLWFYGPAGPTQDRAVLYTDSATMGNFFLRVNGTRTFTFGNDGTFHAPSHVYAGNLCLQTDGNINGSPGSVWANWGANDAYSAINAQIERRAAAYANDRVIALQFRRGGQQNTGGNINVECGAGCCITGYNREAGGNGQVSFLYFRQLQFYNSA